MSFNFYVKETLKKDYVVSWTLGWRQIFVWNSAIYFESSHTHTADEYLTSLPSPTGFFLSLLSSIAVITMKADHRDVSVSRKIITFPNLSLCNHRGLWL